MPDMTLSEAAKWAGVTRPTIHKAITGGRLSARKDDAGQWQINPAELERAYQPKPVYVSGNGGVTSPDIGELMAAKDREIALYRQLAERADATAADLRAERDRLLGIVESATRLLTHQAAERAPAPPAAAPAPGPLQVLRARLAGWLAGTGRPSAA